MKKIHNSHYRQIASVKESLLASFSEENCIIVTKQLLRDCIAGKAEVRQKAWPTLLRLLRLLGVESVNPDMQAINEAAVWRATPTSLVKKLMAGEQPQPHSGNSLPGEKPMVTSAQQQNT